MLAAYNSGLYKTLLVLHILVAIVGLGAVMLNGLYAAQAQKRPGPAGRRAVFEANFFVTTIAEYFIYTIPIFGILLLVSSDKLWKFSQTWVWLALVVYFVAIGISHGVMKPGTKKVLALMRETEETRRRIPGRRQLEAVGKRLAAGGAALNIIVVVPLVLMIWKPGV